MDVALRWLLTHEIALWLGAYFWLSASPLANRIRAHSLAPNLVVANPIAPRILTPCVALGHVLAIQSGLVVARIPRLRTVHLAHGLVAHHLTLLVVLSRRFWAARLTTRAMAGWLAILLADRLRTIPGTMGDTTLSQMIGNELPVVPLCRGCLQQPRRCRPDFGLLSNLSTFRGPRRPGPCRRIIEMQRLAGIGNGYPDFCRLQIST
mmetsp:Transcript_6598/g.15776  ORF Transcript_6598/g.15776 Transcript_6598/m.15776 type:complete len:207 (-) Transcript_6598:132-752(-)